MPSYIEVCVSLLNTSTGLQRLRFFSVLLVFALLTLTDACSVFLEFGASSHGSFGRLADLDTSHTCVGFLHIRSGFLMHRAF